MTTRTIDLTPSWSGVLRILLAAYQNGTPKGQRMAEEELIRMAKLADAYVAEHKGLEQEATEIAGLKRGAGIGKINSDSARIEQALKWMDDYDFELDEIGYSANCFDFAALRQGMAQILREGVVPKISVTEEGR